MKLDIITEAVNKVKNGTCVRIGYTSQVPVKAKFKDSISIKKMVATTVRLGVGYGNIKTVKERQAANAAKSARMNNYSWVVKNKIKYNSSKDSFYLSVVTFPKGDHTKSVYEVCKDGNYSYFYSKDELKKYVGDYINDSYFNKKSKTETYSINIDNVYRVGDVVEVNV